MTLNSNVIARAFRPKQSKNLYQINNALFSFVLLTIFICNQSCLAQNIFNNGNKRPEYVIVLHGGAGNFAQSDITAENEKQYYDLLGQALNIGIQILDSGVAAMDAVEQVIIFMEDSPVFNAGKGAVFTHDGRNELDASIMDGRTLKAGAVAAVGNIKNPIKAARKVMDASPHVLLTGEGASEFAKAQGLEIVDSSYFYTKKSWDALQKILQKEKEGGGTVGCVAFDKAGNLAAGTSTGGMTNKKYGRIGDSPIIGAGTYANNNTCAVSCTGYGEYFIRYIAAYDISAMMEYAHLNLAEAADSVINKKIKNAGGYGGIIAVDKNGNISITFNTTGMFRAYKIAGQEQKILLYK
ncbi:MAG: isoaspartyl peptidase/L-asparaginase [Bacteroidia bacterium]|nr:isoaspartyl peptidase/L-asparaginase [Bacteroidia bacterium]